MVNQVKISTVYNYIDAIAPFDTQMSFDNAGLLVGDRNAEFQNALLCLDITPKTVEEAVQKNCTLIISHHPVIFQAVKTCLADSVPYLLAKNGLTAICAHTNWDQAVGGVNDTLCKVLAVDCSAIAQPNTEFRIGTLKKTVSAKEFARFAAEKLQTAVRLTCPEKQVKTVAVCGGAGSDYYEEAALNGADLLLTGEVKHHEFLAADALGFSLAAAGHYETEVLAMTALAEKLRVVFPTNTFFVSELKNPVETVM
ncbi:MAG: Nif3-like dinuclear metal center hexameric protein [Ruminococcaceae bacterium]|nr:Nif3-like dinuclear metal center hexameric protein [Oscillospiraceae bacterium]